MTGDSTSVSNLKKQLKGCVDPYHFLFEKGNDGVFIFFHGADGTPRNFVDVNQKAYEMLGYTKEELLRLSLADLVVKERWNEILKIITTDLQKRNRYVFETVLRMKDGKHIDVEISGHHFDYLGKGATFSIVRDQTSRKEYERKIEKATEQWRNTFDSITDFVSVHDKDFKFVRVNKALSRFLNKNPQELLGKYCYEVIHGTKEPWENCPHNKALSAHETVTEIIDDSHVGVPLQVRCSPCFFKNGELAGTVHIARDISSQLEEERAKEKMIADLNAALAKVKKLSGLLPICASCKKIRDDQGYWTQIESYLKQHSEAEFSHGICPQCMRKLYPEFVDE